jgi:lipopolysaccharide/colanic/teichoic acid biosynthesis glycosyltransferase
MACNLVAGLAYLSILKSLSDGVKSSVLEGVAPSSHLKRLFLREGLMRRLQGQVVYDEPFVALDEGQAAAEVESASYLSRAELYLDSWRYRYVKRAFDIVLALLMALVFLIPAILIALAIRLTSAYPVFYSEKRIGRNGVAFRIWKFRSMRPHGVPHRSSAGHMEGIVLEWRMDKNGSDPRITRIGRFLRRWSLDEVPQLFNVLRGDMSLIGPRPVVKAETHLYKHLLPFYLAATPGLSGLWQVSGRSNLDYEARARLDATYVRTWSLKADFKILVRTVPTVLRRIGAR